MYQCMASKCSFLDVKSFVLALAVFSASVSTASMAAAEELKITINTSGNGLHVMGEIGTIQRTFDLQAESVKQLTKLYKAMNCTVVIFCYFQKEFDLILKEQGKNILEPLAKEIQEADRIHFHINPALITLPFDALLFKKTPLFIQKPVFYTVDKDVAYSVTNLETSSHGVLVSDYTADPDRGVFAISKLFPNTKSLDISDFDPGTVLPLENPDFVAISAHGHVGSDEKDYIALANNKKMESTEFLHLNLKLIYLDSCNLGISSDFLQAFQRAGVKLVVAPILSNEAGNSSTRTIGEFFNDLANGEDPVSALFHARATLYDAYKNNDILELFWRAFPFRIYVLN